ncbi:MAG: GNAT family N-acetyltransferase [Candidatus Kapaibacterium sp.]
MNIRSNKNLIRKAKKSDSGDILRLIKELAEYEKFSPPNRQAQKRLIADAFRAKPLFNILVAANNNGIIGYAFYYFTYSTFLAKPTLYLEDIFVREKYRNIGIGKMLFDELLKIAKSKKCGRLEFAVLDWNKNTLKFYKRYNAKIMKEWLLHRIVIE